MFDQEDGELNVVIGVLFGVIALVIAFVIGLGVYSLRAKALAAAPVVVVEEGFVEIAEVGEPLVKLYFEVGSAELPATSGEEFARVVAALQARAEAVVLLSGFHDETGGADVNAAVARDRAVAVRAALVAAGVPAERVQMRRPAVTLGSGDAAEARRVEIRVQ